jgi:outer membrane protein assembly factor BamB
MDHTTVEKGVRHRAPTRSSLLLAGAALAASWPAAADVAPPTSAATAPATAPSAVAAAPLSAAGGDWPGFHGGGELRGEAKPLPAKPLVKRWTFKPAEDPGEVEASAAIVGDSAYVGDVKGRLYRLALADGTPKWTYKVPAGFSAPPLVVGGRVYLGDMEGVFHCVSADTGQKVWTFDSGSGQPIHAGANLAPDKAAGDKVVFGNDGAEIIAVTLDGKEAWKFSAGDRVNGTPAVGGAAGGQGAMTYVSGCDAKLRGIDVATGKERFALDLPSIAPGSPALVGDRLVIGTDGGAVTCVAADGSKTHWTYEDVKDKAMVYGSPAVADGIVVVGARDRQVHAINLQTGKRLWAFATRGDVDSSPAISGGRVFVGSRDKKLYVLDLKTGKPLGDFQASRGIEASPAIGQGVVVVGDTSGAVHCLEPR